MIWTRLRSNIWAVLLIASVLQFVAGTLLLRHNPYWHVGHGGALDGRVYVWNAVGHLAAALGLVSVFLGLVILVSRLFRQKWSYWIAMAAAIGIWFAVFGVENSYTGQYKWDAAAGVTQFYFSPSSRPHNLLWQSIVRWQVEPELSGWLGASPLKQTHGLLQIRVISVVPIAFPTLSCECRGCCVEELQRTDYSK